MGKQQLRLLNWKRKLKNSESGFLPLDLKSEFIPLDREVKLVDEATLKFVDEKILRHFGVPLPILTGDYKRAVRSILSKNTRTTDNCNFTGIYTHTL